MLIFVKELPIILAIAHPTITLYLITFKLVVVIKRKVGNAQICKRITHNFSHCPPYNYFIFNYLPIHLIKSLILLVC
jgi:hypothetical protein